MSSEQPLSSVGLEEFCFVLFPLLPSPPVLAGGRAGTALALPTFGRRGGEAASPLSTQRVDVLLLFDDVWLRFHSQLSHGEPCEHCGLKFYFALRGNPFFLVMKRALLPARSLCL